MLELIVLAVGGMTAIGVTFAFVQHRARSRRFRAQPLDARLASIGFEVAGDVARAQFEGRTIELRVVSPADSSSESAWTLVTAPLVPPLDLGLRIETRPKMLSGAPMFSQDEISLKNFAFDEYYRVFADEPHRAIELLETPVVKRLLKAKERGAVYVTDTAVRVEEPSSLPSNKWIKRAARTAALLALRVEKSRDSVTTATGLRKHRSAWVRFAQVHGLHGLSTPLAVWGAMDDFSIRVFASRAKRRAYCLDIAVGFPNSERLGCMIRARGVKDAQPHESWRRVTVGDVAFDALFVSHASRQGYLRRLVDGDVRTALEALRDRCGWVVLGPDGLSVRLSSLPEDPEESFVLVERVLDATRAIWKNSGRASAKAGPYR